MKRKLPTPYLPFHSAAVRSRRLALGAILVASAALASPVFAESPEVDSVEKEVVLGVLRAPAPKVLSEQIVGVARKIVPGPQTEALPFMIGGMLGDPMLEGVSLTENMGAVLLERGDDIVPVLVLKLTEESPLRQTLPSFNLHLHEFDGWTFGLQEVGAGSLIEGREEELISAVRVERRFDIELTAESSFLANKLRELLADLPQMGEMEGKLMASLIAGVAAEADTVADFRIGLDLSPEAIRQALFLQATPGSPLAAFLDQKRPQNFDFAKFIPATDPVLYLGGSDIEATRGYFDHFLQRILGQTSGEEPNILQEINRLSQRFFDQSDGRSGGTFALEGFELEMTQVYSSSMTDEELGEFLNEGLKMSEKLFDQEPWASMGMNTSGETQELLLNHSEINDVSVHLLRTSYSMEVPESSEVGEEELALVESGMEQEMYYAMLDGFMLNTTSLSRMAGLIEAIQSGEPVEDNLASAVDLDGNKLLAWRVDLVGYMGEILSAMPFANQQLFEQLQQKNLSPINGWASAEGGIGRVEAAIPVDTIAAIYQAFMEQMEAQFEQPPMPVQE